MATNLRWGVLAQLMRSIVACSLKQGWMRKIFRRAVERLDFLVGDDAHTGAKPENSGMNFNFFMRCFGTVWMATVTVSLAGLQHWFGCVADDMGVYDDRSLWKPVTKHVTAEKLWKSWTELIRFFFLAETLLIGTFAPRIRELKCKEKKLCMNPNFV